MQNELYSMMDGNQAAAHVAYALNEVIAIYPITPASPMGELADSWSALEQKNCLGSIPTIIEMQSEGGAAGAIHGALQTGALTTTFTASQGLLLMLPNMFKIAGELTPTVFHVASRSIAAQALSIFCDHSDVMSARNTGFALLCSNSVQEVMDFALISQIASLRGRIPVLHFFDGFRTSHEIAKIKPLSATTMLKLISTDDISAHRHRALSPERPVIRGTSQNPDVFFQARESVNPYYDKFPSVVQESMDRFAELTGRQYHLFEYHGAPDAERVVILMGSGCETVQETVEQLNRDAQQVGLVKVRLYRPFDGKALLKSLPQPVKSIAVLDRTKEPGSGGEPLYKDVMTAVAQELTINQTRFKSMPKIIAGRYGLSSKEFTPAMVKAVFDELTKDDAKPSFTIGIIDDVGHLSLDWEEDFRSHPDSDNFQAIFYGLGSDGTVSANKNSIKIIGQSTDLFAQGYFVYDSKKAGAVTISHLRFGPKPIQSAYLIEDGQADFIACHQSNFLKRYPLLDKAKTGAIFLLNTSLPAEDVWDDLPGKVQIQLVEKKIKFYAIDAYSVAKQSGLGKRINTIMQSCFFATSQVLDKQQAISEIKIAMEKTYGTKNKPIIKANINAIDSTLERLYEVSVPDDDSFRLKTSLSENVQSEAPEFIQKVTKVIIAGRGDRIPVSLMPADGTFPVGTAAYEKRDLSIEIPVWETDLCTHCGKCVFVCPHSVIRSKAFTDEQLKDAPPTFKHLQIKGKDYPDNLHISYQVSPQDCTGCGLCVDICPIRDKSQANRKALNMAIKPPIETQEKINWKYFTSLPEYNRTLVKNRTMKGAMLFEPLFEFSAACVGCGETSYLRLASQLFGDRMLVANATGCSSIYGGNLPTTPWTKNSQGYGPAWNNSLFEDNAEFGLGMRIAVDQQKQTARELLSALQSQLDEKLVNDILNAEQSTESGIYDQRIRVAQLNSALEKIHDRQARQLLDVTENLISKSVWIVGGDGWAYDIGFGGLDHVLASGRNVNILVLDTEVYSNTGGQTSKATPKGAVAKFSAAGKPGRKKDLAKMAISYENVYVAQVAYGAKDMQTLHAFIDAESYPGPSLIIAYSPCIAHGIDLAQNHQQQKLAVNSGHWPLLRYDPRKITSGKNPLHLDSKKPSIAYQDFSKTETRFSMLWHTHPERAKALMQQTQQEVEQNYHHYRQLADLDWQSEENKLVQKSTDILKKNSQPHQGDKHEK